jgi:hypothetical protein
MDISDDDETVELVEVDDGNNDEFVEVDDGNNDELVEGDNGNNVCANKHNILMRYYVCNILPPSYHSSVILSLPNDLDMKTLLLSLCHIYLFILHPNFISARSFFFPLCVLYIRHRSVLDECD